MLKILKQSFTEFSEDNCSRMAAALAYYTAFSLAPLMIIIITICGLIWDPADVEKLMQSEIRSVVGQDGAEQVKTMLANASRPDRGVFASIVSGLMLLVGATGLVVQLQSTLNEAWEVKPDPEQGGVWNLITKRILSFGMICGIAFLLLVSLVVTSIINAAGSTVVGWLPSGMSEVLLTVVNVAVSLMVITALFAAMFKFLPDARVAWSDVGFGAGITAVLFVIGKYAMGAYLGSKNMESTYGAAGSLALILVWIYYSAMIFLFGAEMTQVWARQRGSGVQPAEGAVKVVEKEVHVDRSEDQSSDQTDSQKPQPRNRRTQDAAHA